MAVSLYRKYRPARFEDIIGQEHVARTLVNAIKSDFVAESDATLKMFAGIYAAMRDEQTPLAQLWRHLAHAREF